MKPRFDLNRFLDRITAAFLLIVIIVILFLPIAVARYLQAPPLNAEASAQLQEGIAVLQETAEELQQTVDRLQGNVDDQRVSESLEAIDQTLEEVSSQLEQLENELMANASDEEASTVNPPAAEDTAIIDESRTFQDELLIMIGWAVGLLSIITAVLLASLTSARRKRRRRTALPSRAPK